MTEQTPLQPSNDLPHEEETRERRAARIRTRWIKFAAGFVGLYALNAFLYFRTITTPDPQGEGIVIAGLFVLTLNVLLMVVLSLIPKTRWIGFGFLSAMAFNFILSLILGLSQNAVCMIPFFYNVK